MFIYGSAYWYNSNCKRLAICYEIDSRQEIIISTTAYGRTCSTFGRLFKKINKISQKIVFDYYFSQANFPRQGTRVSDRAWKWLNYLFSIFPYHIIEYEKHSDSSGYSKICWSGKLEEQDLQQLTQQVFHYM